MNNKQPICHICQYTWPIGSNGNHSCTKVLAQKLDNIRKAWLEADAEAEEFEGCIFIPGEHYENLQQLILEHNHHKNR